jgi:hypothetical protein
LHDGANFAVDELKKHGIDVDVIWDAPPQANIDDQNRTIEAAIGRRSQEQNWHPRASVPPPSAVSDVAPRADQLGVDFDF